MPLLHRFTMNHPNIAIVLKQANVLEPDDFLRQEVDVLLLVSNDAPETMVGRQLGKLRFGVYSCRSLDNAGDDEGQWIHWTLPGGSATGTMNQQQIHIQRLLGSPVRQVLDAGNHDRAVGAIRAGIRKPASSLTPVPAMPCDWLFRNPRLTSANIWWYQPRNRPPGSRQP